MKTRLLILLVTLGTAGAIAGQGLLITEFKAQNDGPFMDDFGDTSDWIELHNASAADINLEGWYLTDNPMVRTQWMFPATNLAAGRFMIVFASGRNRRVPGGNLHTSFSLARSGEYLALVRPDGTNIAQEFASVYPAQNFRLSYGYPMVGTSVLTNTPGFLVPTPGLPNPPPATPPPLAITEIMFNPLPGAGTLTSDLFEFIELMNAGPDPLNLDGFFFTAGVSYTFFGGPLLGPGQRTLVVGSSFHFNTRYGPGLPVSGQWGGGLSDAGERLSLVASNGAVIFDFVFDDAWHRMADGRGFSLVSVNDAITVPYEQRTTWRASSQRHGSPGVADPPPSYPVIYINEILSRPEPPFEDAIELFNPGTNDVDISGWYLTDNFNEPTKYTMPVGAIVPAGGYLALDEHAFNGPNDDPLAVGFGLGDFGEEIYLFSTDTNGALSGYVHGFEFGPAEPNVTFGRHVTSTGEEHFVPQTAMTFFASNAGPRIGAVVISEVAFHQPALDCAGHWRDPFIELRNTSDQPVALFDSQFPTNGWQLRGADTNALLFEFPPGATLPPGGYVVVTGFDPADAGRLQQFAAANCVAPGTPVFGPWSGNLRSDVGSIELLRPDAPQALFVPYIFVERVRYVGAAPWPYVPDCGGVSLHRIDERAYGDDPVNWRAAYATPGLAAGLEPGILFPPQNHVAHAGSTVVFDASATNGSVFDYRWFFNGVEIPGQSGPTLQLRNIQPGQAGTYCSFASNAIVAGFARIGSVTVFDTNRPVVIATNPPGSRLRVVGTHFNFAGVATDEGPVSTVFLQQDDAPPVPLTGTAAWAHAAELTSGFHTLRIFAVDWAGNVSLTNSILVLMEPDVSRLGLHLTGEGTVGATNAQPLRIGRRYTLRARPTPGHIFDHWLDWETGLVSTNPTFTFTMSSNRTIAAEFVPGPFAGLVGSYNGLFEHEVPSHLNGGYFTLQVTGGGAYSGGLYYRGVRRALHGRFNEALEAAQTINRAGTNDLLVDLQLVREPVRVTGIVREARFVSDLTGRRSGFTADSGTISSVTGRYAVTFNSIAGTSTGVVTIAASGKFTVRGRLPDRSPLVQSIPVCENGDVPFYRTLYDGAGSVFGWVNLHDTTPASLSGLPLWTRTGRGGFTNQIQLLGERTVPSAP